jgi:hypothetical protein
MKYVTRVTRVTVLPEGEPIYSELATNISIVDEVAGEFVEIEQQSDKHDPTPQRITVTTEEWPVLRGSIEEMLKLCNKTETE